MELSHCEEILVLAEQLSFSKAANRLFITQSALSKHVPPQRGRWASASSSAAPPRWS